MTQLYEFHPVTLYITIKTSMAIPKDTNGHFPRSTRNSPERKLFIPITRPAIRSSYDHFPTKFTRQEFIRPYHHQIHRSDTNCTNFMYFQTLSFIPVPPQTKNFQLVEFWPTPALANS